MSATEFTKARDAAINTFNAFKQMVEQALAPLVSKIDNLEIRTRAGMAAIEIRLDAIERVLSAAHRPAPVARSRAETDKERDAAEAVLVPHDESELYEELLSSIRNAAAPPEYTEPESD